MFDFVRVRDAAQLESWLRTRQALYLDAGLIDPADIRDGFFRDHFDDSCHHVLALDSLGNAAGCARLIVREDAGGLHLEQHANFQIGANAAEISGFAVAPEYRATTLALGLIRAMLEIARHQDVDELFFEVEPWFFASLKRIGFPVTAVTDKFWSYNAWNLVATGTVSATFAVVEELLSSGKGQVFAEYFALPFAWNGEDASSEGVAV